MKKIVNIVHGSRLYGTNTPTSDRDFKGIFVPEARDVLLGRIPKTQESSNRDDTRKNTVGELDAQWYSLHHFIRLACQGQTVAIEMLYAPEEHIERGEYNWIWDELVDERERFLCKRMQAFIGYARGQANKYSLKGERLERLQRFADVLAAEYPDNPLLLAWDLLPKDSERTNAQGVRELQIAGKWFGATTRIGYVAATIANIISRYGKRTNAAAESGGVDWKALSHAVRVSYQLEDLLEKGELVFPLTYANVLREIKSGQYDLEFVQDALNKSLARIEELVEKSDLPDQVNHKYWEDWLASHISRLIQ